MQKWDIVIRGVCIDTVESDFEREAVMKCAYDSGPGTVNGYTPFDIACHACGVPCEGKEPFLADGQPRTSVVK